MGGAAFGLILLGWLSGLVVSTGGRMANGSPCFHWACNAGLVGPKER